jgi:hypothetical protein
VVGGELPPGEAGALGLLRVGCGKRRYAEQPDGVSNITSSVCQMTLRGGVSGHNIHKCDS